MKLTTQDVIKEFKKVHGDKYAYSTVNYINAKTPVIIICSEHGCLEKVNEWIAKQAEIEKSG